MFLLFNQNNYRRLAKRPIRISSKIEDLEITSINMHFRINDIEISQTL